jgi:hypothetical protein
VRRSRSGSAHPRGVIPALPAERLKLFAQMVEAAAGTAEISTVARMCLPRSRRVAPA